MTFKIANIEEIVSLSKDMKYDQALNRIVQIVKGVRTHNELKALTQAIKEDELLPLLRVLDASLMSRYSSLLVKLVNRQRKSSFTQILQCHELIYAGKYLEAEKQLKEMISNQSIETKVLERAYWALAHGLIEMKRFGEANYYLLELEKNATEPLYDRWGFYYYQKGDWETARDYFLEGIEHDPKPQFCFSLLQALYLAEGKQGEALSLIEKGIAHVPYYLPLRLEKAKRLKELGEWEEFLQALSDLEEITPYHDYQNYFQYSRAQIYYDTAKYQEFEAVITKRPKLFKEGPYQVRETYDKEKIKLQRTNVVVQKYNYCVPATLSMILDRYELNKSQEEIAQSIFQINGSRLTVAVDYLTKLEMSCQFFFGTVENYQRLIDLGVSIIVCLDYPNSSHVQLVKGFDDNLNAFYFQDPNFLEPFFVTYVDFEKHYGNNQCLSIAVIPNGEKQKLSLLNEAEHQLVGNMYEFSDRMEKNDPIAVKDFEKFISLENSLYALGYVVKFFGKNDSDEKLLTDTCKKILELQPDSDYFKLIIAYAFARANKYKEAKAILTTVKNKNVHLYHFLLGRMAYDLDDYIEASSHFYEALKVESDHYDTWSYLALCSYYENDQQKALEYSEISLDINRSDIWNRMNHGFMLFNEERYTEARSLYSELVKEYKHHSHAWYERARCDQNMGRFHQALRGFHVAKRLDPHMSYPYTEIASIYADHFDDSELAMIELQEGFANCSPTDYALLMTLGDLYVAQEMYSQARACYEKVIEHHVDESSPILSYVKVVYELDGREVALAFLKEETKRFQLDASFMLDAGEWLYQQASGVEDELQALEWLESGLSIGPNNLEYSWNLYVNLVENTPYNERARLFLQGQLASDYPDDVNLMCYIGCLYETADKLDVAEEWFSKAMENEEANTFPYYRLGEMYYHQEDYQKAEPFYQKCLELDEDFTVAYFRLSYIEKLNERPENEFDYLFIVLKKAPDDLVLDYFFQLTEQVGKLDVVESYLEGIQGEVAEIWRLQTLAFIAGLRGDGAREALLLETALAIEPESEPILSHYASVCHKLQLYDEAVDLTLKLLSTDSQNENLHGILVGSLVEKQRLELLAELLMEIELSDPDKSAVFMHAGNAVVQQMIELKQELTGVQLEDFDRIIIDLYKRSYELNPDNGTGVHWLCEYYVHHGAGREMAKKELLNYLQDGWNFDLAFFFGYFTLEYWDPSNRDQYEQAVELLVRCLEEGRELGAIHNNLGQLLLNLARVEEALVHVDQAIAIEPDLCNPYYVKSRIFEHIGDYEQMEEWARQTLQVDADYLQAYTQLSIAVHLQGRTEEAIEYTQQLLERDPSNLNAHYNMACFLSVIGQVKEASEHLQFVTTSEDDDRHYYLELAESDPDLDNLKKMS
ncbi:tetratricopeptide repeat protein [Anaerobacillus alkaliphilus]|uniref:Tetratricopeptide repeat protein n=1 Tax=Anaerobacillus alkaliphilus TaxID=1548597 RepID=A0A4Q0VSJ0_9BACI|nr:tetratricopeptide repeat protein [Anaerobacillus alkaliphilus]RXJ00277.1 tetratricopeptide repeat protein [Anaerobacillus alkaliphilus]